MLYLAQGAMHPIRVQGAFVSDHEIATVVSEFALPDAEAGEYLYSWMREELPVAVAPSGKKSSKAGGKQPATVAPVTTSGEDAALRAEIARLNKQHQDNQSLIAELQSTIQLLKERLEQAKSAKPATDSASAHPVTLEPVQIQDVAPTEPQTKLASRFTSPVSGLTVWQALPPGEKRRYEWLVNQLKTSRTGSKNLLYELIGYYRMGKERWVTVKELASRLEIMASTIEKNPPTSMINEGLIEKGRSAKTNKLQFRLKLRPIIPKTFPSLEDEDEEVWLALVEQLAGELFS
jgi:hypothetical protein